MKALLIKMLLEKAVYFKSLLRMVLTFTSDLLQKLVAW